MHDGAVTDEPISVRPVQPSDLEWIRHVHTGAFGSVLVTRKGELRGSGAR